MNYIKYIKIFLYNSGYNKLFLSVLPAFCALVCAGNTFLFDIKKSLLVIFCAALLQLSIHIFDDFLDWILGKTAKRKEFEQTGIRGFYEKSTYFINYNQSPRIYFYISLLLMVLAIFTICYLNFFFGLIILSILIVFGLINYVNKYSKFLNCTGYELYAAALCAPLCMISVFYLSAYCITSQILYLSLIIFFLAYNQFFTASILNLKSDILTNKISLPIILNNENFTLVFSLFLTIIPYILVILGSILNILPKHALITLILIGHSLYFYYLIYLFIKKPHINIKWHFFMGEDKDKYLDEQKNISWYTVRYKFLRNIFVTFTLLTALSLANIPSLFI